MTLNNEDRIYHEFLGWASKNKMHSFVRNININNGLHRGGYYTSSIGLSGINFGYGSSFFFHNRHIFFIGRWKDNANQSEMVKETLILTVLGRSKKPLLEIFNEIQAEKEKPDPYTHIYNYENSNWKHICSIYKRDPKTVMLDASIEEMLYTTIDKFLKSKEWYIKNGVPYKMGILLSGPPGTGKTSLIKAICAKYSKSLYTLSLNNTSDKAFIESMSTVPENAVVVIEDIDAYNFSINREVKDDKQSAQHNFGLTMSGLLNGLDGVASSENRILIATTNYPEKMDAAILREGRFDLKLTINNMTSQTLYRYLSSMYENFSVPKGYKLIENANPAKVQRLVFENQSSYLSFISELLVIEAISNDKNLRPTSH